MEKKLLHIKNLPAFLAVASLFLFGTLAQSQSAPAQGSQPVQDNNASLANDTTRTELAQFNQFLDSHREIAEQLRKDPSLANNKNFVDNHPALRTYLQQHPEIRDQLKDNPDAFMRREDNFDRREDARGRDATRNEVANFNQFLDNHREIAEQLRKDPSLADNRDFLDSHPALKTYLQDHPAIQDQLKDHPDAFMRQEDNFDRHDDARNRDNRDQMASFREFLGNHSDIAQQLKDDPSRVRDRDYMENHPDFQEYLKTHPDVQDQLMKNPQGFVNSAQIGQNNAEPYKAPTFDAKPKQ